MLECTYDPKLSFDNVKITVRYPASVECMVIEREMILDGESLLAIHPRASVHYQDAFAILQSCQEMKTLLRGCVLCFNC